MPQYHHGQCLKCGTVGALTRDHIFPVYWLKRYGVEHNSKVNEQRLCSGCNVADAHLIIVDYRPERDKHEALLAWLDEHGIDEALLPDWEPTPFMVMA